MDRRRFLNRIGCITTGLLAGCAKTEPAPTEEPVQTLKPSPAPREKEPRITFCGAVREVPGSCHLLETDAGLFLVDCGLYMGDDKDGKLQARNRSFPHFDPKEIKAVFLTHAHVDHNGRLPLLYKKGFRGPVY